MRKILALVLALILVLTGSALAVYDPATDGVSAWDGEVTTITFTTRSNGLQTEGSPILQAIEDRIGVRLVISLLDNAQYNSLIAAQIASGDVPDMFYLWDNCSNAAFQQWAKDGIIWNLEDEEIYEKLPHAWEWLNDADLSFGRVNACDNGLYGLPRMQQQTPAAYPVREDWLELFDMEKPVTPDDLFEYCVKVSTEDPDGNGVDDTWGLYITQLGDKGGGLLDFNIREGFGIEPETVAYKVIYAQDGFMDLMDWYHDLYEAGGIYPEFYLSGDNYGDQAVWSAGTIGCFFKTTSLDHTMLYPSTGTDALLQNCPTAKVAACYPLQPNGTTLADHDSFFHYMPLSNWGLFMISKKASPEAVDAACRFLDFGCTEEGVHLLCNGLEDINYKSWDPENRVKIGFTADEKNEPGKELRLGNWTGYLMVQQSWKNYGKLVFAGNNDEERAEYKARYNWLNTGYIPFDNIDTYPGYAELKAANAELITQLNDEYMVNYIIGKITRDEFTDFLYNTFCPAWEEVEDIVTAVKGPKA